MENKRGREGKGFFYVDDDGKRCMIRCIECGSENYAMAVSSGFCAFCGFDANSKEDGTPTERGGEGKK